MRVASGNPGAGASTGGLEARLGALCLQPPPRWQLRTLRKAALKLGVENVEKISDSGVRIQMVEPMDSLGPSLKAEYDPARKRLLLGAQRFTVDTLLHEMGHALDDLAEPDTSEPVLKSDRDRSLEDLYRHYRSRVEELPWWKRLFGLGLWSDYAAENVHEYLAEGVMYYTRSERSRERLREQDGGLCSYVEGFLIARPA